MLSIGATQKFVTTELVLRFPVCSRSVTQGTKARSGAAVVLEIGIPDTLWGREEQTLLRSRRRHPVEETKPQTSQRRALEQWRATRSGGEALRGAGPALGWHQGEVT